MILRGINFPAAQIASGAQGFFGLPEHPEYKHSPYIKGLFGNIFENVCFVAKTATAFPNKGNVPLAKDGFSFKEFLPKAIYPMVWSGAALNAVGLSNPGFEYLFEIGYWQNRTKPFMLSFMAIGKTMEERVKEAKYFVISYNHYKQYFNAKIALQVNFSCPNTGHSHNELIKESSQILEVLSEAGIPLVPKINALLDPQVAFEILQSKHVDALCCSNTIPFNDLSPKLKIKFGDKNGKSPLENRGFPAGGLSGAPIFPIVVDWFECFSRISGNRKPIIAGGGITKSKDAEILMGFPNVRAIAIGTAAFARPWNVKSIVEQCYGL